MKPVCYLSCAVFAVALLAVAPALAQQVVRVAPFDSVELEGGGHVIVKHGGVQQVRLISGSTAFTRFSVDDSRKLRIDACNNDCPHRYNLEVEITTPRIDALAVSGGGAIDSTGGFPPPRTLALAVSGGGTIDTRAMDADSATAAVDGGGTIRVRADGKLTAAVHGGGKIHYWGNPQVTQAIDGGGAVDRGD
ncbi:MAG: GIN domain-containing protein [Rhizomicrobium sp.]